MSLPEATEEQVFTIWLTKMKTDISSASKESPLSQREIIGLLFSKLIELDEDNEKIACLDLLGKVYYGKMNDETLQLGLSFSSGLASIGFDAYERKSFLLAECAFQLLASLGDSTGKNNYAYMIRRKEVSDIEKHPFTEAITILRDGVKNLESFSLINMALIFALCLKTDNDWKIADDLIPLVSPSNANSICSWWEDVAESGDAEGLLVHLWLLRHKKIESSPLGPRMELATRLTFKLPGFPGWMKQYADELQVI